MLTMTARIQRIPQDHGGGHELEVGELEVTSAAYDTALEQLRAEVPEGWRIIAVLVDR